MKERPIIFSAPMVRAILAGTKSQTRRVVKYNITGPNPPNEVFDWHDDKGDWIAAHGGLIPFEKTSAALLCPYGQPGDRLWVREAWRACAEADATPPRDMNPAHRVWYESDAPLQPGFGRLRASMHMPRWASRITLEITGVRVERLQGISEADARSEGARPTLPQVDSVRLGAVGTAKEGYRQIWQSIHGPGAWEANPWVWVIEFKKLEEQK